MRLAIAVALAACNKDKPPAPAIGSAPPPEPAAATGCTKLAFAESTPVPEASGAAWLEVDGKLALVVISDSGNDGRYAIVDPETGATREEGKLPLAGPGDDLEGAAVRGGKLVVVTSPGWILAWERQASGFALVDGPYPLGPIDATTVCDGKRTNCGRNYEGLCLAPEPGECVGFVASKEDGHLYCLVEREGRLAVNTASTIEITKGGSLADCAFAEDGALFAGSNLFDLSQVYRVDGWQAPASAKVVAVDAIGVGFSETLAARGDVIYRMSDTGGAPSLMAKFRCAR